MDLGKVVGGGLGVWAAVGKGRQALALEFLELLLVNLCKSNSIEVKLDQTL
jgi:hypothetical protein